jgi:uncharacterized protein (DUF302 family)
MLGVILGGSLVLLVLMKAAPRILLSETESKYGFDEALVVLQEAIDKKGWKTPHVHDLKATMAKFNYEVPRVKVFEICKPEFAYPVLSGDNERLVSNMMPCRVSVYEKSDGRVYVSLLNSGLMGRIFGGVVNQSMQLAGKESREIITSIC